MRRMSLVATLVVALLLTVASVASAHHVDAVKSSADCTKVTALFSGFKTSDGPVNWIITVDGQPNTSGAFNAFSGDKTFTQAYSPGPLTGPGAHTVVFRADWPTRGNNNGTFTRTVTGCPEAPPKPLPCPDQPPTAPCNCPPGPAGPAGPPGTTTVITVVENHETVTYVEKSCTSKRVFKLTIAQRLPRDDVFGEDAGQKIVKARIVWRGANSSHENRTKRANAVLRLGHRGETDFRHKRLRVNASFNNVVVVPGVTRVIDEYDTLANGHVLHFIRKVRLCIPFRDGDLNGPTSLPQNGHTNGSAADEAAAAKAAASKSPGYRKAVI